MRVFTPGPEEIIHPGVYVTGNNCGGLHLNSCDIVNTQLVEMHANQDQELSQDPFQPVFWTGSFLKTSFLDRQKFRSIYNCDFLG